MLTGRPTGGWIIKLFPLTGKKNQSGGQVGVLYLFNKTFSVVHCHDFVKGISSSCLIARRWLAPGRTISARHHLLYEKRTSLIIFT